MKRNSQKVGMLALGLLVFALPVAASAATVTRQPGPFPVGMDTWYGSVYNTTSQHDGKMQVGGWGDEYDSLARFDLSGLPLTATQAVIWLNAYPRGDGSTPTEIKWYQNTSQWHTGSVSWSTQPSGTYLGWTSAPGTGWYGVNITTQYNQWRSGNTATPNFGLTLKPYFNNNRFDMFRGSGYGTASERPYISVTYNTSGTDSIPKWKWPLASPSYASRTVTQAFGVNWAGGSTCNGLIKKHNGTDFSASAGTTIYAAEDGIVKESIFDPSWGYNIVMEHTSPTGSKYTSTYWHVSPNSDVIASNPGGFIPKAAPMGTIYNLGGNTHFHLAARMTAYSSPDSGSGASPQTNCGGYLAFPASFVDVNNTSNIVF